VIFLPSGIGGVDAIEEEVTVPVGNHVLKIVECGRYGGEAMLPKVVLKFNYLYYMILMSEKMTSQNKLYEIKLVPYNKNLSCASPSCAIVPVKNCT
jgi:hypothetical protein